MGFWTVLIDRFYYYDGCLKRRTVDSCGNSTCLKTPQSGFLEEAEAVPAESNGPQWKTIQRIRRSLYQIRGLKATQLTKRAFVNMITEANHIYRLPSNSFNRHALLSCPRTYRVYLAFLA